MGKHSTSFFFLLKANAEPDDEDCFTSSATITNEKEDEEVCSATEVLKQFHEVDDENCEWTEDSLFENDSENIKKKHSQLDAFKTKGLGHVAGNVAFKPHEKYQFLDTICILTTNSECTRIETICKGGLRVPSEDFL